MPLDFSKLSRSNLLDTAIEPETIYRALANKPKEYGYLRDVQGTVLERWFARRTERDLVIKMNTGGGKTVVGLLILKSSLNEGMGPAVYLTPDIYLTEQVVQEAQKLGLEVTTEIDPRFQASKAILVTNIRKMVNGRSLFGINENYPIGTIVVDDAHSCRSLAEEQFTLKIPSEHPVYPGLLELFRDELRRQAPTTLLDIEAGDHSKFMLVPFWTWKNRQGDVEKLIHRHRSDKEIEWAWPLVSPALARCSCVISGRGVEISSRCLNIELIRSFVSAKRRIYMTATLADDSVLVTHFQASADSIAIPVTPKRADDIGDRMIIAPQELNPALTDDVIKEFLESVADTYNVVVIVPSGTRAEYWEDVAQDTLTAANLRAGVDRLKSGHVGLVVLVNKYDGVDLPQDACRILVIDGVPEVERLIDRSDASVLEGSDVILSRHIQRIEQGMGRGVRAEDDHCVVILLGSRLLRRMHNPAARAKFTKATLAQLDLSARVAEQLKGKPLSELRDVIQLCLDENTQWRKESRGAVAGADYNPPAEGSNNRARLQREAFDAALLGQNTNSVHAMEQAVNAEPDSRVRGWLKQQLAEYVHHVDPAEAQQVQLAAQKLNRQVTKPLAGVDYIRLTTSTRSQAETLCAFLQETYGTTNQMVVGVNAILEDLVFRPESFRAFEQAMKSVGEHLGFAAHRPEVEFGKGPDVLWAVGDQRFLIIECKNEAYTPLISKKYVEQLSGRAHWFNDIYGPGCSSVPIMVYPTEIVSKDVTPDPRMRIMTQAKLTLFREAVRSLANGVAAMNSFKNVADVAKLLEHLNLTGGKIAERFTVPFKIER